MNQYQELYQKKKMTAEQALELIKDGDYMFSAQAAAEPQAILSKLQHLKNTGVRGTTLNTCLPIQDYAAMRDPEMRGIMDHSGWFFNANLRKIERDVRREDARQDNRDEEERAADEETEHDTPPPSQRAHK